MFKHPQQPPAKPYKPRDTYGDMPGLTRTQPGELMEARNTLGYSQSHLADALNVRADTYRRWETGRAPVPYGIDEELRDVAAAQVERVVAYFGLDKR